MFDPLLASVGPAELLRWLFQRKREGGHSAAAAAVLVVATRTGLVAAPLLPGTSQPSIWSMGPVEPQ